MRHDSCTLLRAAVLDAHASPPEGLHASTDRQTVKTPVTHLPGPTATHEHDKCMPTNVDATSEWTTTAGGVHVERSDPSNMAGDGGRGR